MTLGLMVRRGIDWWQSGARRAYMHWSMTNARLEVYVGSTLIGYFSEAGGYVPVVVAASGSGPVDMASAQTIAGIKTFGAMPRFPVGPDVAAAGTDNTNAAALLEGFQGVTGANGTVGVILPAAAVGALVGIKGKTAGVLKVYPDNGSAINGLTATTGAMSLASGLIPAWFVKFTATQWYSFPLVPS